MPNALEYKISVHRQVSAFIATGAHKRCSAAALSQLAVTVVHGSCWKHFRSNNTYVVLGFSWDTNSDQWSVKYRRVGDESGIEFNRTLESFFGQVFTGELYDGESARCDRFTPAAC